MEEILLSKIGCQDAFSAATRQRLNIHKSQSIQSSREMDQQLQSMINKHFYEDFPVITTSVLKMSEQI